MSDEEQSDEYESEEEEQEEGGGGEVEGSGSEEEESEEEEEVVVKKRKGGKAGKDPNKPKRNMSSFFLYSQAFRAQVKEENPDVAFGDIAKILSKQFKALPEKELKKWQSKAEKDKIRYQEAMKDYVPPPEYEDGGGGGKKGKKAKKDPNAPKRNMSAYFLYSVANRSRIKEENSDASFGDIARLISSEFKALPAKERAKWDKKAADDKIRYQNEMAEYQG